VLTVSRAFALFLFSLRRGSPSLSTSQAGNPENAELKKTTAAVLCGAVPCRWWEKQKEKKKKGVKLKQAVVKHRSRVGIRG
jgi:hypothetical protein